MIRALVAQGRPHQFVHQFAVVVVLAGFGDASPARIAAAAPLTLLGVAAMLVLGDYLHRKDDARVDRNRLTSRLAERTVLAVLGLCAASLVLLAVAGSGLLGLVALLGVVGATLLYNEAKKRRRPGWAGLGRFLAGVALVGLYAAWFSVSATGGLATLAIAYGILDATVNLAGDLRDLEVDGAAGLNTLPLRIGERATRGVVAVGLVSAHFLVAAVTGLSPGLFLSLALWPALSLAGMSALPRRWLHGAAHGPKLMVVLALGGSWRGADGPTMLTASLVVAVLWFVAYRAYVWSICPRAPHVGGDPGGLTEAALSTK